MSDFNTPPSSDPIEERNPESGAEWPTQDDWNQGDGMDWPPAPSAEEWNQADWNQEEEDEEEEEEEEEKWTGNIVYHDCFPEEWLDTHAPETGPKECANCRWYGSFDGMFIGYCMNCAQYIYNGERGRGLYGDGLEIPDPELLGHSIYSSYLAGYTVSADGKSLVKTNDLPAKVLADLEALYYKQHQA